MEGPQMHRLSHPGAVCVTIALRLWFMCVAAARSVPRELGKLRESCRSQVRLLAWLLVETAQTEGATLRAAWAPESGVPLHYDDFTQHMWFLDEELQLDRHDPDGCAWDAPHGD